MVGGDQRGDCFWPVGEGWDLAAEGQGLAGVGTLRRVILFRLRPNKRDTSLPSHSSGSRAARCRREEVTVFSNLRRIVKEP